jgi:hypothetical protein
MAQAMARLEKITFPPRFLPIKKTLPRPALLGYLQGTALANHQADDATAREPMGARWRGG